MEGYGFPPALEPRRNTFGWWATQDLGQLDEGGYLTLIGRLDDSFKTLSGHLVSPGEVEGVLRRHADVVDTAVAPVPSPTGPVIGAVVVAPSACARASSTPSRRRSCRRGRGPPSSW